MRIINQMINFSILTAVLVFGLWLMANTAYAEQTPRAAGKDARVQLFDYDPTTVYVIKTRLGYSSLVQLEDGEELDDNGGLGMGDAKAWSLAVKGNNIFFKPIGDDASTNMILVTNKRSYAFELKTVAGDSDNQTYIARFVYPQPKSQPETPQPKPKPKNLALVGQDTQGNNLLIDADINTNYVFRGAPQLKPTYAWDNGRFTYLKFAHAGDMPTIYRVLPDNSEALVNTHIEGDTLVLQEIGYKYRLRFGHVVGELGNQQIRQPAFNNTGTSDKELIRVMEGAH